MGCAFAVGVLFSCVLICPVTDDGGWDLIQRQGEVGGTEFDGFLGHAENHAAGFVLRDGSGAAVVSTLSQVLSTNAPEKYYLSAKACAGILRRAQTRGKHLPEILREALSRQLDSNPAR